MNKATILRSSDDINAPIMTVDFLLQFIEGDECIKVVYEPLLGEGSTVVLYYGTVKNVSPSVLYFSVFSISYEDGTLLIEVDTI